MEANYLIYAGLILRYIYYILNDTYDIVYLKTKLWKSLLMGILFSSVLVYISFYAHLEGMAEDGLALAFLMLCYVFTGWAVDSVFLSLMKYLEQKFNRKINDNNEKTVGGS